MKANTQPQSAISLGASLLGKVGGRSRSPKKIAASRKNAAKARRARLMRVA